MADERLVLDPNSVADEGVALDLAVGTDLRAPLNLDKWPDPGARSDPASIQIRERVNYDVIPEGDIGQLTMMRLVRRRSVRAHQSIRTLAARVVHAREQRPAWGEISAEFPLVSAQGIGPTPRCIHMKVAAQRPTENGAGLAPPAPVIGIGESSACRRIVMALSELGLRVSTQMEDPAEAAGLDLDASTIFVFVCDVDVPREIASLRRLRREAPQPAVVVVSPPTTGTGVRRALDAGADALVFEPELELTLAATVHAVASGQTVVPRKLRAGIEKPNLSHRERQVLTLVRNGLTNAEIAKRLYLAESTIKSHLSSIFTKFGVRSRKEAAALSMDLESGPHAIPAVGNAGPSEQVPR